MFCACTRRGQSTSANMEDSFGLIHSVRSQTYIPSHITLPTDDSRTPLQFYFCLNNDSCASPGDGWRCPKCGHARRQADPAHQHYRRFLVYLVSDMYVNQSNMYPISQEMASGNKAEGTTGVARLVSPSTLSAKTRPGSIDVTAALLQ